MLPKEKVALKALDALEAHRKAGLQGINNVRALVDSTQSRFDLRRKYCQEDKVCSREVFQGEHEREFKKQELDIIEHEAEELKAKKQSVINTREEYNSESPRNKRTGTSKTEIKRGKCEFDANSNFICTCLFDQRTHDPAGQHQIEKKMEAAIHKPRKHNLQENILSHSLMRVQETKKKEKHSRRKKKNLDVSLKKEAIVKSAEKVFQPYHNSVQDVNFPSTGNVPFLVDVGVAVNG
jgi:hypothetical protein